MNEFLFWNEYFSFKGNWCINKVNKSRQEIIETIEIFEQQQQEIIEEHEYDIEQCDIIQDHMNINHESHEKVEEIGPNSNENWYVYLSTLFFFLKKKNLIILIILFIYFFLTGLKRWMDWI